MRLPPTRKRAKNVPDEQSGSNWNTVWAAKPCQALPPLTSLASFSCSKYQIAVSDYQKVFEKSLKHIDFAA
jgi:hypothetical protein